MDHDPTTEGPGAETISRRSFLARTAAAGAGAVVVGGGACAPGDAPSGAVRAETAPPRRLAGPFELDEVTIAELGAGMEEGRWTAREITAAYLRRIEAIDRRGPGLRSVIETNPEALAIARGLDQEREEGRVRGPLHGIPILLKDNIATHDRTTTTAGSYALKGSVPPEDAFVATRLREEGAVLLGKANLSEWANFRSTRSSSGWSARGGQCRNPYAVDRNPCGSSSGSAAAASASLCAAAIGTETNGSIVCPASACGVVGIKPTVGLVSRSRIIPISRTQDTAGPMARTVADAAAVLGAMTGVDPADPATAASRGNAAGDYTRFLDPDGLRGARIGVARSYMGAHDRVDALMEEALGTISGLGATVVDPTEIPTRGEMGEPSYVVLLHEFKAGLNEYLAGLGPDAPAASLAEIIEFNEAHADLEMPYFGQEIFLRARETGGLDDPGYVEARERALRLAREEGIDAVMEDHGLDAVVAPTRIPAWKTDLVDGDHSYGGSSSPAAIAGYPAVTLPMGDVFGLPVGITFFGRAWSEGTLLRFAFAFERATGARSTPRFLEAADLRA